MNTFQQVVYNKHFGEVLLFIFNVILLKGFSPNNLIAFALFVCFLFSICFFKASISTNRWCKGFGPRSPAPSFEHSCTQPWELIHVPTARPQQPTGAQQRPVGHQHTQANWSNTHKWILTQFNSEQQSISSQWRWQPGFHTSWWSERKHTFAATKSKHSHPGWSCSGQCSAASCPR